MLELVVGILSALDIIFVFFGAFCVPSSSGKTYYKPPKWFKVAGICLVVVTLSVSAIYLNSPLNIVEIISVLITVIPFSVAVLIIIIWRCYRRRA